MHVIMNIIVSITKMQCLYKINIVTCVVYKVELIVAWRRLSHHLQGIVVQLFNVGWPVVYFNPVLHRTDSGHVCCSISSPENVITPHAVTELYDATD